MSETPKSQGVAMRKKVTDKQRLDWLSKMNVTVEHGWLMVHRVWPGEVPMSLRQAIDAAMKSKPQGGKDK